MRALRHLGLGDALAVSSTPIDRSQIRNWRGKVLSELSLGEVGRKLGAPSVGIHRADLLDLLVRALPCHLLHLGATCVGFEQNSAGVTAKFSGNCWGRRNRGTPAAWPGAAWRCSSIPIIGPA